ncbi:hypothetical protein BYT27DRAFT_7008136, partial [Phlegmacium glaucopus]
TPFKAAFGKKPNLREVREWGEKVWVRTEGGDKLGGRVREGRWMGISDESKGIQIYWPDKKTVSTEQNVYYDKTSSSVSRLEGEEWDGFKTKTNEPPAIIKTPDPDANKPPKPKSHSDTKICPKPAQKPMQQVRDILSGKAVASNLPKGPKITPDIQLPAPEESTSTAFEGEEDDWMSAINLSEEYSLVAEMSEVEALEPQTLKEVKSRPDW